MTRFDINFLLERQPADLSYREWKTFDEDWVE